LASAAIPVCLDDVRQASERIRPLVRRTPVLQSDAFDHRSGYAVYLKAENLQRTGSFKLRGAANFIESIPRQQRADGVVAFSSGNHAQAVALAARQAGIPATIVMPSDAPAVKLQGTRSHGAQIILYDRLTEDREAIARQVHAQRGGALIPPFDHPWIIAGQGTCGLELLQEAPHLDAIAVCLGGGGLLAGCAIAAKGLSPGIRVFGVEPERGNDAQQSFRHGRRISIPVPDTIADGLRTTCVGEHNFAILQTLVEDVVTVSEEEIVATAAFLLNEMRVVVEPSGAVAAAACLFGKLPPGLTHVGVTVSGGNAEREFLQRLLSSQ
jgi:threonine dehydratase